MRPRIGASTGRGGESNAGIINGMRNAKQKQKSTGPPIRRHSDVRRREIARRNGGVALIALNEK